MKSGDVPGDLGIDGDKEAGDVAQFGFVVVESRDEEGDNLQPEATLVDHLDAGLDVVEGSAEGPIGLIPEGLEVDLISGEGAV